MKNADTTPPGQVQAQARPSKKANAVAKNVTKNATTKNNVAAPPRNAAKNAAKKNTAASNASSGGVLQSLVSAITPGRTNASSNPNAAQKNKPQPQNQKPQKKTPSQLAQDPVFQCKSKIRNDELHKHCVEDPNCEVVQKCGKQKVGDKEYDTVGSKDWPLGNPDNWMDIKKRFMGDEAAPTSPERKRAFRETNNCIREFLHTKFSDKYEECNKLGQQGQASKALNNAAAKNNASAKNNAAAKNNVAAKKASNGKNASGNSGNAAAAKNSAANNATPAGARKKSNSGKNAAN